MSSLSVAVYKWLRSGPEAQPLRFLGERLAPMENFLRDLRESHLVEGKRQILEIARLDNANKALRSENEESRRIRNAASMLVNQVSEWTDAPASTGAE